MKKTYVFLFPLIAFLLPLFLPAQEIDVNLLKGMKIRNIGPAGMSGRVTSIDAVHRNPEIIYVGTASGGLWKSTSGGTRWSPVFDKQPLQSIGAVAITQSNPDVVWAGTGEGNPRNSMSSGAGIYKSLDGGKTWKLMGLEATKCIHRIVIHRDNPDVVTVAALGSAWGPNPERGVYQTRDGGKSWDKILFVNDTTGCADLVMDPSNPDKMIAAMWQYGRKPWFFNSGGSGSGLYLTYDGGKTWKRKTETDGLPKGELGRIGLAICHDRPNYVYALVESQKTALYRSEDGGETWKKRADKNIGNRPFYYADIYCDPHNENRIYNLFSFVSVSEDGGRTFSQLLGWHNAHPDHHAFWIHPEDPDFLMDGNDGGMAISRDRGNTWDYVANLPLAQVYHINIDNEKPYNIYAGMQDNGSWVGPSEVWKQGGIRNSEWTELSFGDGFDVVPQIGNPRYGYSMYQGGNVYRYDRQTGHNIYVQPNHPEGKELRFNWNAAISADPFNDCGLYFGSQYVHHSSDCGESWEIISPDLTTNDSTKQQQAKSGGLTIDATRAENYTTVLCIAPSRVNREIIWAGTDDGNLQLTTDAGKTWSQISNRLPGMPKNAWIPQIEVSPHDAREAFIVVNNYRQNDWKPYVYHTTDMGQSFRRIATEKEVSGHALSIVQDLRGPNLLFLGTENGLWFSVDKGKNWNQWREEFPAVSTTDLKIHPGTSDLVIGTFGRAIWVLDDIEPLRELARKGKEVFSQKLVALDPPEAFLSHWRQADGERFPGDGGFRGDNVVRGAILSFFLNPELKQDEENAEESGHDDAKNEDGEEEASEEENQESAASGPTLKENFVHIFVLTPEGDSVRYMEIKPDTGLNRVSWGLRRNGVHRPTHRDIQPSLKKPGGAFVLPGRYKVIFRYQDAVDSVEVSVEADPRTSYNPEAGRKKREWLDRHEKMVTAAFEAFERLKSAEEMIATVNSLAKKGDKTTEKELKEAGKEVTKAIQKLKELFMTPKDFEGYDHVTLRLNDWLGRSQEYLESSNGPPGANGQAAFEKALSETTQVLEKVNNFLEDEWKTYQEKVKNADLNWMTKLEKVNLGE